MVKHWLSSHEGKNEHLEFIFRKLTSFKDCLIRRILGWETLEYGWMQWKESA